jgi:two-component system CheB/CheR fusion protein
LEDFVRQVVDTVQEQEQEVYAQDRRWYSLRASPYMTVDKRIDGAVLVLVDIDDLKQAEERVTHARDNAEAIISTAREPLVILRADLKVDKANEAFYKMFQVSQAETENVLIYQVGNRQWDIPELRQLLEDIIPRNTFFNDLEVTHDFPHIGRRTMLLNARRLDKPSGFPRESFWGSKTSLSTERHRKPYPNSSPSFRTLSGSLSTSPTPSPTTCVPRCVPCKALALCCSTAALPS